MGNTAMTRLLALGLLSLPLLLAGCGETDADVDEADAPAGSPAATDATAENPTVVSEPSVAQSPHPATAVEAPSTDAKAVELPYPDRQDLFLPPKARTVAADTPDVLDPDVQLKGFANVGRAKALLLIDGSVVALAAGETRGHVQVLSIDPPRVTLQRGDRQWTESLFESTLTVDPPTTTSSSRASGNTPPQ